MPGSTELSAIAITPHQLGGERVNAVNARELHRWLGVEVRFNDWIRRRVKEYGFEESTDYYSSLSNRSDGRAGRGRTDYFITLDMAKELAMVERNERGRQARRYFIECERRLREGMLTEDEVFVKAATMAWGALNDPAQLRDLLLSYVEQDTQAKIRASVREAMRIDVRPGHRAYRRPLK